jgi:hypothetical protein
MSNGSTDVFFDVLTLAGCDLARTAWEQNLVLFFADGHRVGMGASGFDLAELPWTGSWPASRRSRPLRQASRTGARHPRPGTWPAARPMTCTRASSAAAGAIPGSSRPRCPPPEANAGVQG